MTTLSTRLLHSVLGLSREVVLQSHLGDLIELGFEPVDVSLFLDEIRVDELAGPVVPDLQAQANASWLTTGLPSRKMMRAISFSACFISSMARFSTASCSFG